MTEFLGESTLLRLREHLNDLRLKLSILQKSVNDIKIDNIGDIIRQKLPRDVKKEALELIMMIRMESLFLDSFLPLRFPSSSVVLRDFGSTGALLNRIFSVAVENRHGYVTVGKRQGRVTVGYCDHPYLSAFRSFGGSAPLLAVDICEHAYFLDYGFDKRAYLLAALPHLDLSRLDEC